MFKKCAENCSRRSELELERKYYKNSSPENNKAYKKQKNFCSKLYKKE